MRLDVINLDDGYYAYYHNGELELESSSPPEEIIATYVSGAEVEYVRIHLITDDGIFGYDMRGLPQSFQDIPEHWLSRELAHAS